MAANCRTIINLDRLNLDFKFCTSGHTGSTGGYIEVLVEIQEVLVGIEEVLVDIQEVLVGIQEMPACHVDYSSPHPSPLGLKQRSRWM